MTHTLTGTTVRRPAFRAAVLATAAATALLTAVPAHATAHDRIPGNWLYVKVTKGDAHSSDTSGTLLMCDPPQGHAHAAEACAQLATADGDIGRIPRADTNCPMIYAPVTASAHGEWHGSPVEYTRTFTNACDLAAGTGAVFAFAGEGQGQVRPVGEAPAGRG
ncbi:Subtilisin inhibitor [Actinobacteria bacterium OK074]|nr:Subtilisin inhibitor [Actinobacteria bacterium OK074]